MTDPAVRPNTRGGRGVPHGASPAFVPKLELTPIESMTYGRTNAPSDPPLTFRQLEATHAKLSDYSMRLSICYRRPDQ